MPPCTCPTWRNADDFDGPEDYADACTPCQAHGTGTGTPH